MKAEKIITENIDLKVEKTTLLSGGEYVKYKDVIPLWDEWWWLCSTGSRPTNASSVGPYGSIDYCGVCDSGVYVRPALIISNLKSYDLSVGDKFKAVSHTWTVISDNIALCDGNIGKHCFNSNPKKENSNDYETSDVKKYINEWAEKEGLIEKNMDYKRLLRIFQAYVENDYQASCNTRYIKEALEEVATHKEIEELGFGWIYPEEC